MFCPTTRPRIALRLLRVEAQGAPRTLHPLVRDDIFRIAGEALRNAFRHAGPKQIEVGGRADDSRLTCLRGIAFTVAFPVCPQARESTHDQRMMSAKGDRIRFRWLAFAWLTFCAALAHPAQEETRDPAGGETPSSAPARADRRGSEQTPLVQLPPVIVTAQKRSERLQDVPLSVTSIDAETLLEQNTLNVRDYLLRVPGVTLNEVGSGQTQLTIRGINAGFGGNPLVGITIDDVPFGSSVFDSLGCCMQPELDPLLLDRIEVLRGPQGTFYGANAMGGLLKYVTATPSLTGSAARVEADVSSVAHGSQGYGTRAGFARPLLDDRLALQVSAFHRQDAGFIRDSLQNRANVNEAHVSGGHVALVGKLTDRLSMKLTALYQERSSDGSNMVDIALSGKPLFGPYEHQRMPGTDGLDTHLQFYSLDVTAHLGPVSVTSLTGYQRLFFSNPTDLTQGFAGLLPSFYPGVSNLGLGFQNTIHTDRWTQELRLASSEEARLQYVAGYFYSDERNRVHELLTPATFTSGAPLAQLPTFFDAAIDHSYTQRAIFANVTLKLTDRFDVAAGGRYSRNEQNIFQRRSGLIASTPTRSASSTEDPTTYSFAARYRLSADRMLYARVASGYRTGGPNFSFPPGHQTFDPDTTVNYEVGLKGAWLDQRLKFDAAAYYIDWSKIQVIQTTSSGLNYFTNGGKASSKGVEATIDYRPVSRLRIAGSASYNDAKLDQDAPSNTFFGLSGDRLPFAARWTGNLSADYSRPIGQRTTVFSGVTAMYVGERLIDFSPVAEVPRLPLPAFTTVDLRFGFRMDRLRATLFVRNVADKRGYVGGQNFTAGTTNSPNGPWTAALITPRTIGLALTLDF